MDIKKKGYIKYVVIFFLVIAVFFVGAQMLGNKSDDAGIGDGESTGGSGTVVADFDGGGDLGAAGGEVGTPDGQFADVGGGSYGGEGADTFDGLEIIPLSVAITMLCRLVVTNCVL